MKEGAFRYRRLRYPQRNNVLFLSATLAFLYLRSLLLPGTPIAAQYDAVFFFEHAKQILSGRIPFRDYFAFVMPGTDLLYAGIFRIFGVRAWVGAAIVILLGLALTAVVLRISQKIFPGNIAFLPPLFFLIFDFDSARDATHHWYSTLLLLMALLILLGARSRNRLCFAGVLCGSATLFTQTQGAVGLVAVVIFLIWVNRANHESVASLSKQAATLVVPFVLVVASVLGYYAYRAGVQTLVYALWDYPVLFTETQYSTPWFTEFHAHQPLREMMRGVSQITLELLVPLAYIFCFIQLWRKKDAMDRRIWEAVLLVNLAGIALLVALASGPDYHRLCTVAPPAVIVFIWLFSGERHVDRAFRAVLWTVLVALFFVLPVRTQRLPRKYLDLPTGRTAFLSEDQYAVYEWLAERTHEGDPFFGLTPASFALGLKNPSPMDFASATKMTPPVLEDRIARSLEIEPPKFIFIRKAEPWEIPGGLPEFVDFVRGRYHPVKKFPSGEFWERNESVGDSGR